MRKLVISTVVVISMSAVGCSTDPTSPQPDPSPTVGFQVVEVTPIATPTPTSTPVPEQVREPVQERESSAATDLAPPIFPDWLDPDIATVRPTDEEIFDGWQRYLENTALRFPDGNQVQFCSNGVVVAPNGEEIVDSKWRASRSAAVSDSQWGQVSLIAEFGNGQSFTVMQVERRDGNLWQLGWQAPAVIEITRSERCLEYSDS